MEPEQKVSWEQIVLPLGLMVAVFVFVGFRATDKVRTEASQNSAMCQALAGCIAQANNEEAVCNNPNSEFDSKCEIAQTVLKECKYLLDINQC